MNSAISFSSPDSSGSDNIDWLAPVEGAYPDSGVQTDVDYSQSCALTSELMAELLQPAKQVENHCSLSFPMDPSVPIYSQHSQLDYNPQTASSHLGGQPPTSAPCQFDTEQLRLVHMRREYQKMLLDIEKKIIENKISWIDQAARSDQMMMCQESPCPILNPPPSAAVPFSTPSDLSPDKMNSSFPIFHQEAPPPPPSPPNFVAQESQAPVQHFASHSKTHKTPVRRNSGSRMQPYFNHASEAKEGVVEIGGVKKRQSHNAIEERYRKRINSRIQELKSIVAPDEPLPKSNILAKALAYIRDLEEKNRLLQTKVSDLTGPGHASPAKDVSHEKSFHPKLSPNTSSSSSSPSPPLPPHKSRSSTGKLLLCLLTVLLCLLAPDPISIRALPSAFPSWDQVGGLGSAGFRSRTLLYFSDIPVTDTLQPSLSLLHPFTLLSWSVRLSLICLSLVILAYSARVPLPRALSIHPSHFTKLYSQAGVAFREKRLSQSLSCLETALGQFGVSVELSRGSALLSLLTGALYLYFFTLIRSSYLRIFTRSHKDSDANPALIQEAVLTLLLAQRVQSAREKPLCSLYAALAAHSLALSHHSLPLYLMRHSHTTLRALITSHATHTTHLLDRCALAVVRRLACSSEATSLDFTSEESLAVWCQIPQQAEEWDLDQEVQTHAFCLEFTSLLKGILSTGETPTSKLRFSALVQSLPTPTDELTHWWVTLGLFASDSKQRLSSQHNCSLLFKSIPPPLLASQYILPKALVLTCKLRLSVHSSPLHRPSLLLRLSEEAGELAWSSVQLDAPPADNRDLFSLLQALTCEWLLDGLEQIWRKSSCLRIQHRTSQSYVSALFILEKLVETHPFLSNFSTHYSSLSTELASSNPIHQLDSIQLPLPATTSKPFIC